MRIILLPFVLFIFAMSNISFAEQSIMDTIYMADKPEFDGDNGLTMIGEFGFLLANGNSNASTFTANINTSHELTSWSYQVIGNVLYKQSQQQLDGQKNTAASAQRLFLSGQVEQKLTQADNRIFIYGEYENNRFNGFRYQAGLAAGWSSKLWQDKHSELKYSIGPGYAISEVENENSGEDRKGLIVRAAMEYKIKFSDQATFRQFVSTEAGQEFTRIRSETSLSTKLTGAFTMRLSFFMNIDTNIGPDIEELDTEAAVTLVYQFF